MEKHIPVTHETSRSTKIAVGVGLGAVGVAAAVVAGNTYVNHLKDVANENMGNAIFEQVTGEKKSSNTYDTMQSQGIIDLQIPAIDVTSQHGE